MKDIEERIKKLLRLGRSTNQAEAQLALQRAFELAQKHRLSIEELDLDKDLEAIAEKAFPVGLRFSLEHKLSIGILHSYYNVRCVISGRNLCIFGTETDVLIAEYVFAFLIQSIRAGANDFKKTERQVKRVWNNTKRANYIRGFIYGLHSKLTTATAQITQSTGYDIVRIDERVQGAIDGRFGNALIKVKAPESRQNTKAMSAGWDKGRKTQINQPIAGEAKARLR